MTSDNVLLGIVVEFLKLCMFAAITMMILHLVYGSELTVMRFSTNLFYGVVGYVSYLLVWIYRNRSA